MTEIFKNIEGIKFILNWQLQCTINCSNPVKQGISNMQFFL